MEERIRRNRPLRFEPLNLWNFPQIQDATDRKSVV